MPEFKTTDALVLSTHRLSEHAWLLSLLTAESGRYRGAIKTKIPPQIGSFVHARWQARLNEQTGRFYIEQSHSFWTRFMNDRYRLNALMSVCFLADTLLPERQTCNSFYQDICSFLTHLADDNFLMFYVRLEWRLLETIGFGLDTSVCAGGGDRNDLAYISPKTGRAVSREKGLPYHDKLLKLPAFLWRDAPADKIDIQNGLTLTAYFLKTYAGVNNLPVTRADLFK